MYGHSLVTTLKSSSFKLSPQWSGRSPDPQMLNCIPLHEGAEAPVDEEAPGHGMGGLTSGPGGDQGAASRARGAEAGQEGAQGRTCHEGAGGRNQAHNPASVNEKSQLEI